MTTTPESLRPWLGSAYDELTANQLDRLCGEADRINARHPGDDDRDLRDAALSAAVQYLLNDTTADEISEELGRARRTVAVALAAAKQYGAMLKADAGRTLSEENAAKAVGIERQTLREAMGLSRNRGTR